MLGRRRNENWITALAALAVMLQSQAAVADNRLVLRKESDNLIAVELSNTDAVAGFQFSVNGRGGVTFGEYQGSERTSEASLGIYQYLKDDSTLNIVILAPVRSALPVGNGVIGKIFFALTKNAGADTARVFLSKVVLCTAQAQYLDVTATQVEWNLHAKVDSKQMNFALNQNYPNPFNPSTTISYRLDKPAQVRLAVYDITGRQVESLVDQHQLEGQYTVKWNASVHAASQLASGMYFARLQVGDQVAVQKMILAK
ncbi:MAG: T9SS type A sorting domain-containing protein [Ignavibacteriales bacterium]|nr:T9SS type A sorting domain-containing protein [Ignavibacteriales bacterium]